MENKSEIIQFDQKIFAAFIGSWILNIAFCNVAISLIMMGVMGYLAFLDNKKIKELTGNEGPSFLWAVFFIPVYFYKRSKLLNTPLTLFWVTVALMVGMFLLLFGIGFGAAASM